MLKHLLIKELFEKASELLQNWCKMTVDMYTTNEPLVDSHDRIWL